MKIYTKPTSTKRQLSLFAARSLNAAQVEHPEARLAIPQELMAAIACSMYLPVIKVSTSGRVDYREATPADFLPASRLP